MKNCIFCKIISGEDPQSKNIFISSDDFVVMFDSSPVTFGHAIVFPKKHYPSLSEMSMSVSTFFTKSYIWAEEIKSLLGAKAYTLKLNNELFKLEKDPRHVGHVHMHITPRFEEDDLKRQFTADNKYFNTLLEITKKTTFSS